MFILLRRLSLKCIIIYLFFIWCYQTRVIQACGFVKPLAGYIFNSNISTGEKKGTLFYVLGNIVGLIFFFYPKWDWEKINPLSTYQISLTQVSSMKRIVQD